MIIKQTALNLRFRGHVFRIKCEYANRFLLKVTITDCTIICAKMKPSGFSPSDDELRIFYLSWATCFFFFLVNCCSHDGIGEYDLRKKPVVV